jgi:hypothetical protein
MSLVRENRYRRIILIIEGYAPNADYAHRITA